MKVAQTLLASLAAIALAAPAFAQGGGGGNNAPSGSHYNLNISGKAGSCVGGAMTGSNRHTIFVMLNFADGTPTVPTTDPVLDRRNKIFLQAGDSFRVVDGNACDGEAIFQLPVQECGTVDLSGIGDCRYDVYIRGLGKPGGQAVMTTCRMDQQTGEYQCSLESVTVSRTKGKSSFSNVTKELTSLCLDTFTDGNYDGNCDVRELIFGTNGYQYYWDYDNYGLRLAQLRFYPGKP